VPHEASVDQVVQGRRGSSGALRQLEQRRRDEPIPIEADEEVAHERADAFLRDHPEVIAVVGHAPAFDVEPRGAGNAMLSRIAAGDDRRRGGRGD
jgi:hypothetical protein